MARLTTFIARSVLGGVRLKLRRPEPQLRCS
jgi:hypothetical protein